MHIVEIVKPKLASESVLHCPATKQTGVMLHTVADGGHQ